MAQLHSGLNQLARALFDLALLSALIQLAGALIVVRSVVRGAWMLLHGAPVERVRALVADGVLGALSFTLMATLLNSILVHTWLQVLTFAAIVVFRFVLGRLFRWERARALELPSPAAGT